jgi:hypothetical protein
MSTQEIIIDNYRFQNFSLAGNTTINFTAETIEGRDITETDSQTVRGIFNDLGKWESLIRTGLHMLSDLRITQIEQSTLQSYEKPCGIELYEVGIGRGSLGLRLDCSIHIKLEERHKREQLNVSPIFSVEEITSQLTNIPKWKAFEKTMKLLSDLRLQLSQ